MSDAEGTKFRAGHVAIVGKPNVGKSTLLNHLLGVKLSITSRKAQTTRQLITGILTTDDTQYVFVDTPGFQEKHRSALNDLMNRNVRQSLTDVDAIVWVTEAKKLSYGDKVLLPLFSTVLPVVAAINKIDRLPDKKALLPYLAELSSLHNFAATIPVSAKNGTQLDELLKELRRHLPVRPALYDREDFTDRDERFLAAEFVREKIFRQLGDELPYGAAVTIEKFEQQGSLRRIFAVVIVNKANHKAILLGARGERMKQIATEARLDMERLFGGKVYLEVWIKVKSGWTDSERALQNLGFS